MMPDRERAGAAPQPQESPPNAQTRSRRRLSGRARPGCRHAGLDGPVRGNGNISRIVYFQGDQVLRREEDSAGGGRMDIIETFSQGQLAKRLRDSKRAGKWDIVQYFKDNELVREERDTDGDGFFDLRIVYDKGNIARQEADTNSDRRVDVWVKFENNERVEQLEDQNFRGKVSARYMFKGGELVGQEQIADGDPPSTALPFIAVEEELRSMASYEFSRPVEPKAVARVGMESINETR